MSIINQRIKDIVDNTHNERYKRFMQKIILLGFWQTLNYYFRRRLNTQVIKVKIPGVKKKLLLRPTDSDIDVLIQVFYDDELDINLSETPIFIVDGGAYVGYSTVYFANKYPQAQIIAIEPDEGNFDLLSRNCQEYKNIHLIHGAVWISNAPLSIYNPSRLSWSLRVSEMLAGALYYVVGITIPQILKEYNAKVINLLKLDIEGSEEILFAHSFEEWLDKIAAMVIELHGKSCEESVFRALSGYNFTIEQKGEKLFVKSITKKQN